MLVIGTTEGVFLAAAGEAPRASDLSSHDVKVLRQADGHVLAGTNDGVYRSADGGRGWQQVGLQGREVLEVMPAPRDPTTVYAGTVPAALFRSRDGGATWSGAIRSRRHSTATPGASRRSPAGRQVRGRTPSWSTPTTPNAAWWASRSVAS